MHSPLKTMFRKIGDRYQAYSTMYMTHAMATYYGGTGCPIDKDINLHEKDKEGINTGLENNNKSTSGLDITVA